MPERTEDPRVTRTRATVLEATLQLIGEDGPEAVTFQAVARQAGVGRSTLYRHWPHPDDLVVEALADIVGHWEFSGPGGLREEMIATIDRRRAELNQPLVRIAFTAVMSRAARDPSAAELRDRLVGGIVKGLRAAIRESEARGELRPGLDAEDLAAEVMGQMVWRSFVLGKNVSRAFIERVVTAALADWEPR